MDKIDELLTRGVDKIYPSKESLEKVLRSGKKLRLYQGFDPSGIKLHVGHMTGLMKLRQYQELGHNVIFLIGDGTGQAGDPSGKARTREKFLTNKELRQNAKDYVMQAGKIVKFSGPNAAEILYNGDWLNKLNLEDILDIAGHFTLQYLEERDMFVERKSKGAEINFREFMYPLLQGYDSVAMKVDLELGGSDQTFNMLAGRKLVREMLKKEKFVMTTPLLADASGKKIGKTEGNVIALTTAPNEFYGMIMSLSDDVIDKCFEYITDVPMGEVERVKKDLKAGKNPMIYKKLLAYTLTKMLNSEEDAKKAQKQFESIHQASNISWMSSSQSSLPSISREIISNQGLASGASIAMGTVPTYVSNKSEFRRLENQNAIEIINPVTNEIIPVKHDETLEIHVGDIIKIGKKIHIKIKK